ncbi:ABC transporter permease [Paractinoplanes globisporus]|uniref:FtsX-like permease family protein n=1 Tax=Paractinoplanes globisporus TaxID=113565 RepID=A0ABW6WSY1_9ACTN|nr:FtsX-like permease family protein [Actinoplanes globisporus]
MRFAWQMVRHRFASFAGTFVAITLGVAVVAGAATLYLSSRPEAPERYSASPVLVRSPSVGENDYGEPEYESWTATEATGLATRLAKLPGVTAAAADPMFYVQRLIDGRATGDPEAARLDGHAWSSAALGGYRLAAGTAPDRAGEVAMAGSPPGTRIDVLTAEGPATWTVTGTTDGPGFYVPDAVALRMSPGVRVIGLTIDGDAATVATAARGVAGSSGEVVTGGERDSLEPASVTRVRWLGAQLLIALVGLGAFAAVFVVASTCALSAAQRRREIGLLRAVGATPGQVRRMMYAETLVIAVLAALAGLPIGALTAPLLAGPFVDAGLEPAGFTGTVQPLALAGAFLLGVVVALAGVAVVARRASRAPALDALRDAAVEWRAMTLLRWIAGVAAAVGGVVLLARLSAMSITVRSTAGLGGAMLLLTAAALLAPVVIVPLVRLATWPWRRAATGMLVREGTLVAVRRVASTAAPVLLTVGFTVLLTGTIATIDNIQGVDDAAKLPAATVVAPDGVPGLSDTAVTAQTGTSRLPTRVLITHGGGTAGYDAAGVPATEFAELTAPTASPSRSATPGATPSKPAGSGATPGKSATPGGSPGETARSGGTPGRTPGSDGQSGVVLDPATAKELGAARGTVLELRWADGTDERVPVRAVVAAEPGVLLPRELVRRHDPAALTDVVLLDGPPVAVAGARVMPVRDYVQIDIDEEGRLVDLFLAVLIGLTVGYTGLAVANTLLMATAARRDEFRALRLAGATTGQVLRVTSAEAVLAVAVGTALAALVAVISLEGVRSAVEAELDRAVPLVVPWGAAVAVTVVCGLVAVAATAGPVLRHRGLTAGGGS